MVFANKKFQRMLPCQFSNQPIEEVVFCCFPRSPPCGWGVDQLRPAFAAFAVPINEETLGISSRDLLQPRKPSGNCHWAVFSNYTYIYIYTHMIHWYIYPYLNIYTYTDTLFGLWVLSCIGFNSRCILRRVFHWVWMICFLFQYMQMSQYLPVASG